MAGSEGGSGAHQSPALVWGNLGALYWVWGTTYLAIAGVNETLPPLLGAAARFLMAGPILLLMARARGRAQGAPPRSAPRQWRSATIIGTLLLFGGNGAVAWAERTVPTGVVALIIALVPIWLALMDRVVLRSSALGWRTVVGLVAGFAGASLLVGAGASIDGLDLPGMLFAVGASLSWSAGTLYARKADMPSDALLGSGMQQVAGGVVLFLFAAAIGDLSDLNLAAVSVTSWASLAYLVVFGSLLGFSSYLWLVRHVRTSLVSTYAYVNPVVAVFLGWLIRDETISLRVWLAGGIILASVALIVSSGGTKRTDVHAGFEEPEAVA